MKTSRIFISMMVGIGLASCVSESDVRIECLSRPITTSVNAHYVSNRAPLQPTHFIKLPVGSVRPEGWIGECLRRQRDGMNGRLTEISVWLDKKDNAWLNSGGKGLYGWEEVPYWLRGYADLAYILDDPKMTAEAEIWLNGALNSQREDGFFGPWIERRGNPDLWGNMLMLWCLQSHYERSGDPRVIPFMKKYFQWQLNFPEDQFLKHFWEKSRGGDNLYSVYWLYNITGERWLLDLADKIHRNTADWRQESTLPNWHVVNVAQCFREPATWWMQSADSADLRATYNDFRLIRRTFGQVPGGMYGADENCRLGFIDPRQGAETCGAAEQMNSDEMLLRFTGDPFWGDHCEEVAFNTYPAMLMPDFKALRYITSPNMTISDEKNHSPDVQNEGPFFLMNPLSNRCCQHNHGFAWPYYAQHLWTATPDNGLAALLFGACSAKAKVADGTEVNVTEETNYPFEEQVRIRVDTPKDVQFPLYVRIPAWCDNARVLINGKHVGGRLAPGAYARIERTWKNGDKLTVDLPMSLHVRQWQVNQNSIGVNYGPLSFSLKMNEIYEKCDSKSTAIFDSRWQEEFNTTEWPAWKISTDGPWNYGLRCDVDRPEQSFTVIKKSWPANNYPFTVNDVPIEIKAKGRKIPSWGTSPTGLCGVLPTYPARAEGSTEELTLIPMGAARLRISAFPPIK